MNKVIQFTIPVAFDKTIIIQDEVLPHFYNHLHRHEEIQLTWVRRGEGTLIAGNNVHLFNSGEIYFLGANMPHLFKSDHTYFDLIGAKNIHATTIFFNPKGALASLFNLPELKSVSSFLLKFQSGFKVPYKLTSDVADRMQKILLSVGVDQFIHFLHLLTKMSNIQNLEPLAVDTYPSTLINDNEGMRIDHIYNYLIQNYKRPLTLEEVAAQAFMTPHSFCRYFKKHTRHTLLSFLNRIRVNEACKLLIHREFNGIPEVAYSCGFNSITNFNRVFKSTTGLSPKMYAAQYRTSLQYG